MRILLVHNHYGSSAPSGENRVFELERDMLRGHGHEVETLERFSDDLRAWRTVGTVTGAILTPWNPLAARAMAKAIRSYRPDIVHAHNIFPMLSPSIFAAARGVGRVLTLHNYRLACPAAIPIRGGRVCTDCIDAESVWPAVRYGCYRNSRTATLPLAVNVSLSRLRGTWRRDVERFIALTAFQRDLMVRAGLPAQRIALKPNFYPDAPKARAQKSRRNAAVFVGRLSLEKGVGDLIDAWSKWGPSAPDLHIVGDGPMRTELEKRAANTPQVKFLGQVSPEVAQQEISAAKMLILPSRCIETFGLVLLEAFRVGTPVAVSNVGPLPDLACEALGTIFRAGDPDDLLQKVSSAWIEPEKLQRMSIASLSVHKKLYTEGRNHSLLIDIYEQAISAVGSA